MSKKLTQTQRERKKLITQIKKNMVQINNRYDVLYNENKAGNELFKMYKEKFKLLTGSESKRENHINLGSVNRFGLNRLNMILSNQNEFLENKLTTSKGRLELARSKSWNTIKDQNAGLTFNDFMDVVTIFNTDVYQKLKELRTISSDMVVSLYRDYKPKSNAIEDFYDLVGTNTSLTYAERSRLLYELATRDPTESIDDIVKRIGIADKLRS